MEVKFYPAFLDLKGKQVLVVGGGPVALQKAKTFLRCGARVSVVAKEWKATFPASVAKKRRAFRASDLDHMFLACSAADDERVNREVARLSRKKGVWVNVVDRPKLCDFIVPASVARGPLVVAISTGGASPGLAKFLREKMEKFLKPEYVRLAGTLGKTRAKIRAMPLAERRAFLKKMFKKI